MRNLLVRVLLCIAALTLFGTLALTSPAQAQPTTVFVATNGNDDTGTGAIDKPFKRIQRAAYGRYWGGLPAGSTIYLRQGVYYPTASELIHPACNGAAGNPTTIRSYGTEWAVLDGSNVSTADTPLLVVSASNVKITLIGIRNSKTFGMYLGGNDNEVSHCSISNSQAGGLRALNSGHLVYGCSIFNNVRRNIPRVLNGGWEGSLEAYKASNVTFDSNTVYENWGEGILFQNSQNCVIKNNTVRDNYSTNVYLDSCYKFTVDNNTITSTGKTANYRDGAPATGIMFGNEWSNYNPARPDDPWANPNDNHTISNNRVSNVGRGLFKWSGGNGGGGLYSTKIYGNTFEQCWNFIVKFEAGDNGGSQLYGNRFGKQRSTIIDIQPSGLWVGSNEEFF